MRGGSQEDKLKLVIAIVDDGGHLVLLHRDDGAQVGSVEIAILKARTAVLFKRPTKAFQDVVEDQGRFALLCIPNGIPLDGGVLLNPATRSSERSACRARATRKTGISGGLGGGAGRLSLFLLPACGEKVPEGRMRGSAKFS